MITITEIKAAINAADGNKSLAARQLGISRGKLLHALRADKKGREMRLLFLDIETAPNVAYTWGMFNQNLSLDHVVSPGYTLCFSAKWAGEDSVRYYARNRLGALRLAEKAWELLDQADAVCTYNGKKFDLPVLRRDFVLHGLTPPKTYYSIDLYRDIRSQFRFASNKLDFVTQQLGLGGKVRHKGMELWSGCMGGKVTSWEHMERYNKQDVILLEKLYNRIRPFIKQHPNMGFWAKDPEALTCPVCGSGRLEDQGIVRKQSQSYQGYVCLDCGTHSHARLRKDAAPKGLLRLTVQT